VNLDRRDEDEHPEQASGASPASRRKLMSRGAAFRVRSHERFASS
jgi:hypothetical protein